MTDLDDTRSQARDAEKLAEDRRLAMAVLDIVTGRISGREDLPDDQPSVSLVEAAARLQHELHRVEMDRLRAEVAELRDSLRSEVRTRRLVVVDDNGAERIASEVTGRWAELAVRSADKNYTAVMYVQEPDADEAPFSSMHLSTGGTVVVTLGGDEHGQPSVRLDDAAMAKPAIALTLDGLTEP